MAGALEVEYVALSTDAGLGSNYVPDPAALRSPGNVNHYALQNPASASLNNWVRMCMSERSNIPLFTHGLSSTLTQPNLSSILAKGVISSFYEQLAESSYWSKCSQGCRQAFMLAQRYAEDYDGIAAAAPAFN